MKNASTDKFLTATNQFLNHLLIFKVIGNALKRTSHNTDYAVTCFFRAKLQFLLTIHHSSKLYLPIHAPSLLCWWTSCSFVVSALCDQFPGLNSVMWEGSDVSLSHGKISLDTFKHWNLLRMVREHKWVSITCWRGGCHFALNV